MCTYLLQGVDASWALAFRRVTEDADCIVLRVARLSGLLETLVENNGKLKQIRAGLESYCAKKKLLFPRYVRPRAMTALLRYSISTNYMYAGCSSSTLLKPSDRCASAAT